LFSGTFFIPNSHALIGPPAPGEDPSLPHISLQIVVRNSDGALVTYLEPTIFYLINVNYIHQFLDVQENKTIIVEDGISYEQIEFESTHYTTSTGYQKASYGISWKGINPLSTTFNGYISEDGDSFTATWKIIRTIQ